MKRKVNVSQYCIANTGFKEVLQQVPEAFNIDELGWEVWSPGMMTALHIPAYWSDIGVKRMRQSQPRLNANGTFKKLTKDKIESLIEKFCHKNHFDMEDLRIKRIKLSNGKETLAFKQIRKDIEDPKRKKKKRSVYYLGLTSSLNGNESMLERLNAKKIYCQIHKEPRLFYTCSEKP